MTMLGWRVGCWFARDFLGSRQVRGVSEDGGKTGGGGRFIGGRCSEAVTGAPMAVGDGSKWLGLG